VLRWWCDGDVDGDDVVGVGYDLRAAMVMGRQARRLAVRKCHTTLCAPHVVAAAAAAAAGAGVNAAARPRHVSKHAPLLLAYLCALLLHTLAQGAHAGGARP
jgi:hypothetical protein